MNLQELLIKNKDDIENIKEIYKKLHPLFEDYEFEYYGEKHINNVYTKFFDLFDKKYKEMLIMEIEPSESIIFVLNLKECSFEDNYQLSYINSFSCKKNDILNKMSEEFSMWNEDKPRIEHYCYDYTPIKELLNTEIFYSEDISEIEVICTVLHEVFLHGFTEKDRKDSLEKLKEQLDISLKDALDGNTIDADVFFEQLENEILESASDDEKVSILKERELKKKNKNRNKVYSYLVSRINHKKCIQLVEEWCIQELLKGNIKI